MYKNRSFFSLKIDDALLRQRTAKWSRCPAVQFLESTKGSGVVAVAREYPRGFCTKKRATPTTCGREGARTKWARAGFTFATLLLQTWRWLLPTFPLPSGHLFALDAPLEPRGDAITIEIKPSRVFLDRIPSKVDFFFPRLIYSCLGYFIQQWNDHFKFTFSLQFCQNSARNIIVRTDLFQLLSFKLQCVIYT